MDHGYVSYELGKLDYSGRSKLRVKMISVPELLNVSDFPETKWLTLPTDVAQKVADVITNAAREFESTNAEELSDANRPDTEVRAMITVHVIELSRKNPNGMKVATCKLPVVPRTGDIVYVGCADYIVERAVFGAHDDMSEVDIQVRQL